MDYHDRIDDLAFSPRLGVVFQPAAGQALRFTWNRAFNSPTPNDLFMDYLADNIMPGMDVRLRGIPQGGLHFVRQDGQLQMRSPLAQGGPAEILPADATQAWGWDHYQELLQSQLHILIWLERP